jgi:hypothetical protein
MRDGADVQMGLDHSSLKTAVTLQPEVRNALAADLAL